MTRPTVILLSVVLAAAVFAVTYWQAKHGDLPISNEPAESAPRRAARDVVGKSMRPVAGEPSGDKDLGSNPGFSEATAGCLSPAQIETHPMLSAELGRLDLVTTSGPTIASYRGLSAAALQHLAVQGDSAAMAVLGAVSVMRARNISEDRAVPYLLHEESELRSHRFKRPLKPEVVEHYREASDWFYKAALHGRIHALYHVGEILWTIEGGPVELGWIDQDEFDAMRSLEKGAFYPASIYNELAFTIVPQLRSGPVGEMIQGLYPHSERRQLILNELAKQFDQDRKDADLPPIIIAESTAPSLAEMRSMLCESYLESKPSTVP